MRAGASVDSLCLGCAAAARCSSYSFNLYVMHQRQPTRPSAPAAADSAVAAAASCRRRRLPLGSSAFVYSSCVSSRRMDRPVSPHAILITGPARANDTILDPSRRRIASRSRTPFTKDRNFRSARERCRCTGSARVI